MQCPNCGAPASPDATRCGYCRARLATIACPSCLGPVFTGTAYCPRCGTPASRAPADAAPRVCPRCRERMSPITVGEVTVHDCGRCDGVWVDPATFERLCSQREHATLGALATRRPPREAPDGVRHASTSRPERVRYRKCPDCQRFMNRVNFARGSGIVLDVCREHGTFFDPGELRRLMDFIGQGGLARAREAQIAALDERRREIERLEAARAVRGLSTEARDPFRDQTRESVFWAWLSALTRAR